MRRSMLTVLCSLVIGGTSACGAPATAARTNVPLPERADAPLPPEANRNGPAPASARAAVPGLTLWCSQPMGVACTAAQAELGTEPTPAEGVPAVHLRGARDLDNDCDDPDLAPLMERVTAAIGVSVGGWTDQEGELEERSRLPDLFAGSGCANASRPGDPPVKVAVVDIDGEPHVLVRIWEVGDPVQQP